jgi:feruloyl esterase
MRVMKALLLAAVVLPARIVARKGAGGAVTRARPPCSYPQHAVYSGTGSTDQAENFVCR